MSDFIIEDNDNKLPVLHAVFENLKVSVEIESKLLKEIEYMEKYGLTSTVEYKLTKMRQFEVSFFALFLLRLTQILKNKKQNETYMDCIRTVKIRISSWKKGDRGRMRREFGKSKYTKKIIHECIEESYKKSMDYLKILENQLKEGS